MGSVDRMVTHGPKSAKLAGGHDVSVWTNTPTSLELGAAEAVMNPHPIAPGQHDGNDRKAFHVGIPPARKVRTRNAAVNLENRSAMDRRGAGRGRGATRRPVSGSRPARDAYRQSTAGRGIAGRGRDPVVEHSLGVAAT